MILFDDGQAVSIPVHGTDQVADVTGAGDTVLGTFALAVAAGATRSKRRSSPTTPAAWW